MALPIKIVKKPKDDDLLGVNEENFRCYITMLQDIVGRYSGYSSAIKGWAAAAFIIAMGWLAAGDYRVAWLIPIKSDSGLFLNLLPVLILLCFWILDSWFLQKERTYRNLYTALISDREACITGKSDQNSSNKLPNSGETLLQEIGVFRLYMGKAYRDKTDTLERLTENWFVAMFSSKTNGIFYAELYSIWLAYTFSVYFKEIDFKNAVIFYSGVVLAILLITVYYICNCDYKKEVKPKTAIKQGKAVINCIVIVEVVILLGVTVGNIFLYPL